MKENDESHLLFITQMAMSRFVVFQANGCSLNVQQVTQDGGGSIMLLGMFSLASLGYVVMVFSFKFSRSYR